MLFFSSLLRTNPAYKPAANRLFAALDLSGTEYQLLSGTRDIWLRDFMPVQIQDGSFVSFRYEPSYLENAAELKTNFKNDLSSQFSFSVIYSDINLDGGNIVFSPSKEKAIISNRIFRENPAYRPAALIQKLENLLHAQIIIIPSLPSDMTGHSDGMVRFLDENTVIGNDTPTKNGLEQRIKSVLTNHGIDVIDFPYYSSPQDSAIGCYINFLETDQYIFLPVFGNTMDDKAIVISEEIFSKTIVPVNINEIAKQGGVLNCISWETKHPNKIQKIESEKSLQSNDAFIQSTDIKGNGKSAVSFTEKLHLANLQAVPQWTFR